MAQRQSTMELDSGKVSIVLPTLNGERFINESIASCIHQTYSNIELIVVDGGSTDKILQLCEEFDDVRVRVIRQVKNDERLPGALNDGFAVASGEFFTWTQDDDYFEPGAIEVLIGALKKQPDVDFVYSGLWLIDENGEVVGAPDLRPPRALYWSNPVGHCFLYRRTVADRVGPYDASYFMAEDMHYWMRIFRRGKMLKVPGRLYYHRLHSESLTVKDYGNYFAARLAAKARREVLGTGWRAYLAQISPAYIMEAFAAHSNGDLKRARECIILGLLSNPTWLRNRGVLSIGVESIFGSRRLHEFPPPTDAKR